MLSGSWRRVTAACVLVFWLTGALGPLADVHALAGDAACGDPSLASPHPVTQFENVRPPVDDGHCELCHLQRIVRTADQPSAIAATPEATEAARAGRADLRVAAAIPSHLAPRAPPIA